MLFDNFIKIRDHFLIDSCHLHSADSLYRYSCVIL